MESKRETVSESTPQASGYAEPSGLHLIIRYVCVPVILFLLFLGGPVFWLLALVGATIWWSTNEH